MKRKLKKKYISFFFEIEMSKREGEWRREEKMKNSP